MKNNLRKIHQEKKDIQTALLKTVEEGKVVSLQIKKGKVLKEHVSKTPAILICINGKALYEEESRKIKLKNGSYVMIEPDVKHKVTAIKKSNFILIK